MRGPLYRLAHGLASGLAIGLAAFALVFTSALAKPRGAPPAAAAVSSRQATLLSDGWHFRQSDAITDAQSAAVDDAGWQTVSIPHTWNRIGNEGLVRSSDSNSTRGIGWYRLHFKTAAAGNKRYFLQFDGAGLIAEVWLNGQYLGKHMGAFGRFRFDATAALKPGADNLLVVKTDNSKPAPGSTTQDTIPHSGDFFIHGGLYRPVTLITTSASHVDLMDFGGPGVYARATAIGNDNATVEVRSRLVGDAGPARVTIETQIQDAAGAIVAAQTSVATAGPAADHTVSLSIAKPHLWNGTKDPYLYRVTVTLRDTKGATLDRVIQPLGLRTIRFDPDKGFFLNGVQTQMRGAARHQDRPAKGWAISRADIAQDFDILQDMGANAVRLAHYQHDQFAYDLTDSRGILVWAEIPAVNAVSFGDAPANAALTANAEQQLKELIRQNYNHPSIVVWSIANEIDLVPTLKNTEAHSAPLLHALNDLAHAEDPGRPTTMADCCERFPDGGSNDAKGVKLADHAVTTGITDTIGYNRYMGWYYNAPSEFGPFLDKAHRTHPALPMSVSEYGAGGALTQHSDNALGGPINPHGRPHPEEVQNWYHEESWKQIAARPYIWGVFVWNMFDFSSDSRQEGDLSEINEKGLVSFDRSVKKDSFYYYRAQWNPALTVHLTGRRYVDRAYGVVDVKAYSNAAEARLLLNGADAGTTHCTDGICVWPGVRLASGENALTATASKDGATLTDTVQWEYTGALDSIHIKAGDVTGLRAADGTRYGSDNFFSGGQGKGVNPSDTAPDKRLVVAPLYDSYRVGNFAYDVPVPDGHYSVTLRFAEPSAKAGERAFDVTINGKVVLAGFDVAATAGGPRIGTDRTFEADAVKGVIHIAFTPVVGEAIVSAIDVAR